MVFDYKEMLKEALETGQTVTRSYDLSSCYDNAPATVSKMTFDTTANPPTYCYHNYQAQFAPMMFTRRQLKHLIREWIPRKQCDNAKVLIPLSGTNVMSHV